MAKTFLPTQRRPWPSLGSLLCALLACLLLPSCIEGEEEIWVNADASGKARIEVSAPTLLFDRFGGTDEIISRVRAGDELSENITVTTLTATTSGSKTTFLAACSFQDARELGGLLDKLRDPEVTGPSVEERLAGQPKLEIAFPNLSFHRAVDISSLVPTESNNAFTRSLLGDASFTYQFHLPTAPKTHNADTVSNGGKSLQWNVPLTELMAGPVEMSFVTPIPNLSRYLTLAIVGLLLALLLLLTLWRKFRETPQTPS